MKVALVCDWLTEIGGAERVLKSISDIFPDAPIYTSQYRPKRINWFLNRKIKTGWLNIFPAGLRKFMGPLRQIYFQNVDLSKYDLIISVTGAEAKAVKHGKAKHICYCHVPTQYYWQFYDKYLENPGFGIFSPVARLGLKLLVKPLRRLDYKSAQRPDFFITISEYAKEQIKTYYNREGEIIHPPVLVKNFSYLKNTESETGKQKHFINFSRQVNWKRLDLAVMACLKTGTKLTLIGEGSEHKKLLELANSSRLIKFLPKMTQKELNKELSNANGYIFPSLEPFGIAPIEAMAAGCPVIAYEVGGAKDFIKEGENGILFTEQSIESLVEAIKKFEKMSFQPEKIIASTKKFSNERFVAELQGFIKKHTGQ